MIAMDLLSEKMRIGAFHNIKIIKMSYGESLKNTQYNSQINLSKMKVQVQF